MVCFLLRVKDKRGRGGSQGLNFAPVPIFHGLGSDKVAFIVVAAFGAIFQHNERFALDNVAFVAAINVANAKVKSLRKRVVAIKGADFELLSADGVVVFVFHIVFLVTGKDTREKRGSQGKNSWLRFGLAPHHYQEALQPKMPAAFEARESRILRPFKIPFCARSSSCFCSFFCSVGVLGKLPIQAGLA